MQRLFHATLFLLGVSATITVTQISACSASQIRTEKRLLDLTQTLCVLAHGSDLPKDVATACAIDEALVPEVQKILDEHQRAALRQYGGLDAGVEASAPAASASAEAPPAASSAATAASSAAPSASTSPATSASAASKKKRKLPTWTNARSGW